MAKLEAGTNIQTDLVFAGLHGGPGGLAVDGAGNLYASGFISHTVLKMAVGTGTQTVQPFTDLDRPEGVAVDGGGNLDVVHTFNDRVLKLSAS
ncbi:hypothetical protein F0Q45_11890 [Mycobacterium simiae]|uniref:SMP-30/Gluconolactonase/LRE-like region domain-containing protein n=1 Tax=Mycobacterium simiae TaxID=1784 RepID=A0A5B1BRQ0_MYCSI|nr:hypothetical protein F0Q45_11890 [Mycobacterium simiae]